MKKEEWFLDKTEFSSEIKTSEICIGKNLSWQRLSQLFPEAKFTEPIISDFVMKFDGLTYVMLKDNEISQNEEFFIDQYDENGYWLLDIKTGKPICDSLLSKKESKINTALP